MPYDLIIRNAMVLRDSPEANTDIAVMGGRIVAVAQGINEPAKLEVDATGLWAFPGVVDAHVHFNDPGHEDWEGVSTGSRAFAVGGGTVFVDMPLNSLPVTVNEKSFGAKLARLSQGSLTDFALWGGLVPGNLGELPGLAACGVVGFKAFMCHSGLPEFGMADDVTLLEGMALAARLGLPVAVHAESDSITGVLAARLRAAGRTGIQDYVRSRPVVAELEAISRAVLLAQETGCALHVVHVSSGRGVALLAEAKARGVDVTVETCPHYLAFTEDDLLRLGAVLKCAPPPREPLERDRLWDEVLQGHVDTLGSDHSPAPPGLKTAQDFFAVWGGVSGVQSTLLVMLAQAKDRGLDWAVLARLLSGNPAKRFGLQHKGKLEVGFDADVVLIEAQEHVLQPEDLQYRHRQSPYVGERLGGVVRRVFLRGETLVQDGQVVGTRQGQFVRPQQTF